MITKWDSGVEYDFEPNPNYWMGPDFFKNSKVIVKVVQSPEDRELLLKKGDVDLALGLPFKDLDSLKADPNVKVFDIKYTRLFYLGMNNKIAPFDNVKVRQAVSYAVPVRHDHQAVHVRLCPEGDQPDPQRDAHAQRLLLALWIRTSPKTQAALKDAGVPNGFPIELSVRQSIPQDADAAVWIQASLAKIGVNVTINKMTDADFFDKLNKHQLPFFIHDWYSWGNDPAYQLSFLLKSGAFTNYADYSNKTRGRPHPEGDVDRRSGPAPEADGPGPEDHRGGSALGVPLPARLGCRDQQEVHRLRQAR